MPGDFLRLDEKVFLKSQESGYDRAEPSKL
jgi:hypothetical protein